MSAPLTYLALCHKLCIEAGIPYDTFVDVTGNELGGDYARVANWVADAWDELQIEREDWWWMRGSVTFQTEAGTNSYTGGAADLGEWDIKSFKIYPQVEGKAFEGPLTYVDFSEWDALYNTGVPSSGRPTQFTVTPGMSLAFNAVPDAVYIVSGRYGKAPTTLQASADVPGFPAQFHPIIYWRGLMKYATYEAAPEVFAYGKDRADFYLARLEKNQLSPMQFGEPLA